MSYINLHLSVFITKGQKKQYYLFGKLGFRGHLILTHLNLNNLQEKFPVFALTMPDLLDKMRSTADDICKYRNLDADVANLFKAKIPKTPDRILYI